MPKQSYSFLHIICLFSVVLFAGVCLAQDWEYDDTESEMQAEVSQNPFGKVFEGNYGIIFIILDILWIALLVWIVFFDGSYWMEGNPFSMLVDWEWFNFNARWIRFSASIMLGATVIFNILWFLGYLE